MAITSLSPMRSRNPASFLETTDFSQHRRQSRSGYETEKSRPPTAPLRKPRSNSAATFSSRPETSTRRFKLQQRSRQPALEVSRSDQSGSERGIRITRMDTFLPPIETPQGLMMKLAYYFTRRQFGKVLTPLKVHSARVPPAFGLFYAKIGKLDKKLLLPPETVLLIREQVARINVCLFCMDIGRSFTIKASMNQAKFEALDQYRSSALFTDAERAALDYVTELTRKKEVNPETFARLADHYSE